MKSKLIQDDFARKLKIVTIISGYRLDHLIKLRISRSMVHLVDGEDVRQDVFLSILRGPDPEKIFRLHKDGGLRPWLIVTIRNTVLQVVRTRMAKKRGGAYRRQADDGSGTSRLKRVCDGRRSPLSHAAAAEVKSAIWAALAKLEPPHRRAMKLLLDGHSNEEIAKLMYRSIASVRGYIRRGLVAMRGKMGREENWFPNERPEQVVGRFMADHQETGHKGDT